MVKKQSRSRHSGGRFADDASRWQAIVQRDRDADDVFFYSVATTGVYCRPSCASRLAKRANVRFHATREDAERAGFRPCKRCRPNEASIAERQRDSVTRACRMIEAGAELPKLSQLADAVGMSPYYFHRVFKMITGVTPKAYAAVHRTRRVRDGLANGATVTEAIYGAGFNSNGRFYANATGELGMTPTAFRAGGNGTTIRFAIGECSLGLVLVAASEKGVCAIFLGDDPKMLSRELKARFSKAQIVAADSTFNKWITKAINLVEKPALGLDLPLDIRGTAFQVRVWNALRAIPPGSTASYTEIARKLGLPTSARAVAGACAANHIAIAIPCHRVVRTNKSLSGYRWGVERKAELLRRERK